VSHVAVHMAWLLKAPSSKRIFKYEGSLVDVCNEISMMLLPLVFECIFWKEDVLPDENAERELIFQDGRIMNEVAHKTNRISKKRRNRKAKKMDATAGQLQQMNLS